LRKKSKNGVPVSLQHVPIIAKTCAKAGERAASQIIWSKWDSSRQNKIWPKRDGLPPFLEIKKSCV
jgi:hypothetical protein